MTSAEQAEYESKNILHLLTISTFTFQTEDILYGSLLLVACKNDSNNCYVD